MQINDIEKMHFSASDLNNFSAATSQSADKTFEQPAVVKHVEREAAHAKDFFEQIYDKSH